MKSFDYYFQLTEGEPIHRDWRVSHACSCALSCVCGIAFKSSLHYVIYYMFKAQFNSKWKCSAAVLSRPGVARQALKIQGKEHVVSALFEWLAWQCPNILYQRGEDSDFIEKYLLGLNLKLLFLLLQSLFFFLIELFAFHVFFLPMLFFSIKHSYFSARGLLFRIHHI